MRDHDHEHQQRFGYLAEKELRDALHNRWFVLYTLAFIGLSLAFSYMSLAGAGIVGFAGFGRTAASLINLVLVDHPVDGADRGRTKPGWRTGAQHPGLSLGATDHTRRSLWRQISRLDLQPAGFA